MLSYYPNSSKRDIHTATNSSLSGSSNRRKIKDFSYNHMDRIGKGFSSVVYRGTNDLTSKSILSMQSIN